MMESNTNKGKLPLSSVEVQWRVIGFPLHKASAGAKNRKILLPCRLSNNLGVRTHSRHAPLSLYGGERIITILDDTSSLFGMSQCTHMNNQLATKGWWRFADNSVPRLNWNFVTCHVVQSHGAQLILTTYDIKKKHTHTLIYRTCLRMKVGKARTGFIPWIPK